MNALGCTDVRTHMHPFSALGDSAHATPRIIRRAFGVHVYGADGCAYLDAGGGLWCTAIGYGRGELADVMCEESRRLSYAHSFSSQTNEFVIRLSEKLLAYAPRSMSKVFYANSGSEANDTQVKIARLYNNVRGLPNKKKIIARQNAYHGSTIGAASLTGLAAVHRGFDLPIEGILRAECPDYFRRLNGNLSEKEFSIELAESLERQILAEGPETVAAFIAEPIRGSCGVVMPPESYFQCVQEVLRRHDVLMIADEVITAFGRIGEWFASTKYGIEPDLISVAKGLTSGYWPMSACLIGERIWNVLADDSHATGLFAHGFTSSGHPVGAAVALRNLEIIEREALLENAARIGQYLQGALRDRLGRHPLVGDVRGSGLLFAVELNADRASGRPFDDVAAVGALLGKLCWEEGLLIRGSLSKVVAAGAPPLVLTTDQADEIVTRLSRALDRLAAQV